MTALKVEDDPDLYDKIDILVLCTGPFTTRLVKKHFHEILPMVPVKGYTWNFDNF